MEKEEVSKKTFFLKKGTFLTPTTILIYFLFMGNQVLTFNMNAQILPAYTGLGFTKELKVLAREMYMHVFSTRQHKSRMNFLPFLLFLLNA